MSSRAMGGLKYAIVAGVGALALAVSGWLFDAELLFPSKSLAELARGCDIKDRFGKPVAFEATPLPPSFRPSRKHACEAARALVAKSEEEQREAIQTLCEPAQDFVRRAHRGDWAEAIKVVHEAAAAGNPHARAIRGLVNACRSEDSRVELAAKAQRTLSARNMTHAVYSLGQFTLGRSALPRISGAGKCRAGRGSSRCAGYWL